MPAACARILISTTASTQSQSQPGARRLEITRVCAVAIRLPWYAMADVNYAQCFGSGGGAGVGWLDGRTVGSVLSVWSGQV